MFAEDGGGLTVLAIGFVFADSSDMEMMFADSWKVVGATGIIPFATIADDKAEALTFAAKNIPDSGYLATDKILALTDIKDGSSM